MTASAELAQVCDPIASALEAYQTLSDGQVRLDVVEASRLVPTPEKPYLARSDSLAVLRDGTESKLVTIAFLPHDGTGDESTYRLGRTWMPDLPQRPQLLPRDKSGTWAEISLAVFAAGAGEKIHRNPALFAGSLAVIGLISKPPSVDKDAAVGKVGYVGQVGLLYKGLEFDPVASITVGPVTDLSLEREGERKRDPHAIYNAWDQFVVASFLAIPTGASDEAFESLRSLAPRLYE